MKKRSIKKFRHNKNKTAKHVGGLTIGRGNVPLYYNNNELFCDVCKTNNYEEIPSAIDKSKFREVLTSMFFGNNTQTIDNTSVIMYVCNTCGNCRIIRNKDPLKITITNAANPALQLPVQVKA